MKNILFPAFLVFSFGTLLAQDAPPAAPAAAAEPAAAAAEDEARWSDFLPLNKEMAGDADLPLPFGIGVTVYGQEQDMNVNSIKLKNIDVTPRKGFWAFSPLYNTEATNLEATKVASDIDSKSVRLDAWVLPFLNVYGVLGTVDGKSTVTGVTLDKTPWAGSALDKAVLDPLAAGIEASGFPFDYEGDVYGVGAVLAGELGKFWGTLDINYTQAKLDGSISEIDTVTVSPRIGINGEAGGFKGSLWIGSMHQDVEENQIGSMTISDVDVDWDVLLEQQNEWNFLVGGSIELDEQANLALEAGFGDREQFMGSLTIRF
jgi:hypothetical protein